MDDPEKLDFIKLYKELEDGSVDDIAGNGYWHLEKMKEGKFCLVLGEKGELILNISEDNGDITVKSRVQKL